MAWNMLDRRAGARSVLLALTLLNFHTHQVAAGSPPNEETVKLTEQQQQVL